MSVGRTKFAENFYRISRIKIGTCVTRDAARPHSDQTNPTHPFSRCGKIEAMRQANARDQPAISPPLQPGRCRLITLDVRPDAGKSRLMPCGCGALNKEKQNRAVSQTLDIITYVFLYASTISGKCQEDSECFSGTTGTGIFEPNAFDLTVLDPRCGRTAVSIASARLTPSPAPARRAAWRRSRESHRARAGNELEASASPLRFLPAGADHRSRRVHDGILPGKHRARLVRVVADGDHPIQRHVRQLVDVLGPLAA